MKNGAATSLTVFFVLTLGARSETGFLEDRVLMEFEGHIYPKEFLSVRGEAFGHHLITWKEGRTAKRALIRADVSDRLVAETLAAQGVVGGNNLDEETWDARKDKNNPAADERVEGSSVEIFVSWEGTGPTDLRKFLGMSDAEFRFGDQRSLIPVWRSGCIVCAVSCPGAKISNRSLTIRDQAEGRLRPTWNLKSVPPDGTRVKVWLLKANEQVADQQVADQ
jgi:hypothetical protein